MQSLATMMVVNNIAGAFNDGVGCATGDYFMEFNIANQSAAAPDPVLQLQDRFDDWREGLIGKPDAEQSQVTLTRPVVPADAAACACRRSPSGSATGRARPVAATPGTLGVSHAPGSAGRASISSVAIAPDGTASVTISSPFPEPGQTGSDAFAVRVEPVGEVTPTNRAVTLMPFARLAPLPTPM